MSHMRATLFNTREASLAREVREPAGCARGHLPPPRHIPLAALEKRVSELDKFRERAVIVNCASGNRSGSACGTLRKHGFARVFNLTGGISAWDQAGLPVTKK